jgi:hypothetical protein
MPLCHLTTPDRCSEHVGIEPVIISELKLRDVQRHVFGARFVERADDAALEDRPKALNRVGVNSTNNILMSVVIDRTVRVFSQIIAVSGPSVGCQQTDFVRDGLAHKIEYILRRDLIQNAGNHIAFALHRADDRCLLIVVSLFIPMSVGVFTADVCFINLDNPAELGFRLHQCSADFVAHAVRGLVGAEAHLPLDLQRRNSFLAGQHEMRDLKPVAQRLVGILKDCPDKQRKPIALRATRSAFGALPVPLARMKVINGRVATARAANALRPAAGFQISPACIIVTNWETRLELAFRHVVDGFRTFCHGGYPHTSTVGGYCHG